MNCPNCGAEREEKSAYCSNCGYQPEYPHVAPEPFMKSPGMDTLLGFLLGLGLIILFGIGVIADPILYLVYRRKLPAFARGIGFAALIPLAMILGLLVLCIGPAFLLSRTYK